MSIGIQESGREITRISAHRGPSHIPPQAALTGLSARLSRLGWREQGQNPAPHHQQSLSGHAGHPQ